jgi:hypothetical protein
MNEEIFWSVFAALCAWSVVTFLVKSLFAVVVDWF